MNRADCLMPSDRSLPIHGCSLLAYRHLPRQHAPPSVSWHVQSDSGERGHLPVSHEEHVQPQAACTQEV